MLKGKNIIIISNEPWGDIWYSKHNYAFELSRDNTVCFINPTSKWSLFSFFRKISLTRISDSLFAVNYPNFLPSLNKFLFKANNFIVSLRLKGFFKRIGFTDPIFWSFDPYRLYDPELLGSQKSVFHIVDKYSLKHLGEKELCENVDRFICVSPVIAENYRSFHKKMIIIPHAISGSEFDVEYKPKDLPQDPYGLYVGNIDKRLDYKQIEQTVKAVTEIKFVFIGNLFFDETNEHALNLFVRKLYPNVIHLKAKAFKELKNYIHYAKFCFAFMDDNFGGNRIAHHKIFQYLAHGKPVFCSVFSDYQEIKDYLYMEDDLSKTINNIRHFLAQGESAALNQKRIEIAGQHTFVILLNKIEKFLDEQ